MKEIKISVIIPAYNVEKYFRQCLDSILGQTIQELEIIIINDGSSDGTQQIIDEYASSYPDKIIAVNQPNKGQSSARNHGLQYVRGKYLAFIDADDYIYNDYFETLLLEAEKNHSDLVICSYEKFDNNGNILLTRNTEKWNVDFGNGLSHVFQYSPCAKLYLSDMILKNHVVFMEGEKMEDGPFGIITSSIAKNVVVLGDYYGYRYRVYEESTMGHIRKKGISKKNAEQQFPYKGIENAIIKVTEIRGKEYYQVLEYVVAKALAGFVFQFSAKSDKETQKYVCHFCYEMINTYFPDISKNPYMKVWKLKKLPLSHRCAVVIFKRMYQIHGLYYFAKLYHKVSSLLQH